MDISLIGYGKMGRLIEQIALKRGHRVVCVVDVDNLSDLRSKAFRSADVAIEFTAPGAAYGLINQALDQDLKVVTGTTGLGAPELESLRERCRSGLATVFHSTNFSLGVYLFRKLNVYLARLMDPYPDYDVTLSEAHHAAKKDAPSGTAVTLAEELLPNLRRKTAWKLASVTTPDGTTPASAELAPTDLRVTSLREGQIVGRHTITYSSSFDTITITHDARDRAAFAFGAVLAAEYTASHTGWLTMDDLIR